MLSFAGTSRAVSVDLPAHSWSYAVRIMPLGDSITSTGGAYRAPLWWKLVRAGIVVDFVGSNQAGPSSLPDPDHQGIPGITADGLIPLIPGLMATYTPDIILLMIGTNDVEVGGLWGLRSEVGQILQTVATQSPNTTVFVSTLPPIRADVSGSNLIPAANDEIRAAVAEAIGHGAKVRLVEPQLTVADLADGDHPNQAGNEKLAQTWYDALMADLSAARGIGIGPDENNVTGSEAGDRIIGNEFSNVLLGRAGDDAVYGQGGNDLLYGGDGADGLRGGDGPDVMYGGRGDDHLSGGTGNDTLRGDAGRDILSGGTGYDRFVFTHASNSKVAAADVITDFRHGDKIDLRSIDANTQRSGNQAFKFVAEFTGSAGQLQWDKTSWGYLVSGDINGDGRADFAIKVHAAFSALHSYDFIL